MLDTLPSSTDFEALNWHDNHIHGFAITGSNIGSGALTFDIDYISEWKCGDDGNCTFMVTPSTLIFFDVSALKITLDYATTAMAVTPICVLEIHRNPFQYPNGFSTYQWRLALNYLREFCTGQKTIFLGRADSEM